MCANSPKNKWYKGRNIYIYKLGFKVFSYVPFLLENDWYYKFRDFWEGNGEREREKASAQLLIVLIVCVCIEECVRNVYLTAKSQRTTNNESLSALSKWRRENETPNSKERYCYVDVFGHETQIKINKT